MKEITVKCGDNYKILLGNSCLGELPKHLNITGNKIMIITDQNVGSLYLDSIQTLLSQAGYTVHWAIIPGGEACKTLSTVEQLYNELFDKDFSRRDAILALGGGIVGDIAGFTAATYMRGIDLVQVPTTLIAQTDSAVGGKDGVNFKGIKNLIGCFYQPKSVFIDTELLKTLPKREYNAGMAEIIKYAVISSAHMFNQLQGDYSIDQVVYECLSIKSDIVGEDERDNGKRHLLNFGHTIAHAVEAASQGQILHGEAVAMGMYAIAVAGEKMGITKGDTAQEIKFLCEKHSLSCDIDKALDWKKYIVTDKKRLSGSINEIFITEIGHCVIENIKLNRLLELL